MAISDPRSIKAYCLNKARVYNLDLIILAKCESTFVIVIDCFIRNWMRIANGSFDFKVMVKCMETLYIQFQCLSIEMAKSSEKVETLSNLRA